MLTLWRHYGTSRFQAHERSRDSMFAAQQRSSAAFLLNSVVAERSEAGRTQLALYIQSVCWSMKHQKNHGETSSSVLHIDQNEVLYVKGQFAVVRDLEETWSGAAMDPWFLQKSPRCCSKPSSCCQLLSQTWHPFWQPQVGFTLTLACLVTCPVTLSSLLSNITTIYWFLRMFLFSSCYSTKVESEFYYLFSREFFHSTLL